MKKILIFWLLCQPLVFAQDLKFNKPETVGMSTERLNKIENFINSQIDKNYIPGAVMMIARNSSVVYSKAIGKSGIGEQEMKVDDIFRLASMTKPIVSTALMILLEEGKCLLEDPVSKYIPEFKNTMIIKEVNAKDSTFTSEKATKTLTIRHLLSHTSGIGYAFTNPKLTGVLYAKAKIPDGANIENFTIAEKMKLLAQQPLLHEPGAKWTYGLSTDMLGYLIEVISGKNLSDFVEERILVPLKMNDTHFFRDDKDEQRLVPVYTEMGGKIFNAMSFPQAKNLYFPTRGAKRYYSGGSGLSSTATDYMRFMQMIVNGGILNGTRIISRKSVEAMSTNQIGNISINERGTKFGLGFSVETTESTFVKLGSPGRLGWSGLYNTVFWIDPKEKIVAVLLTQIYPTTHQKELYDTFENLVYSSIID